MTECCYFSTTFIKFNDIIECTIFSLQRLIVYLQILLIHNTIFQFVENCINCYTNNNGISLKKKKVGLYVATTCKECPKMYGKIGI